MEPELSSLTLGCLKRAGWFPGRKVDASPMTARLTAWGYVVSPAVDEFLQAFGGLHIETRPDVDPGMRTAVDIEVDLDLEEMDPVSVRYYDSYVGKPLCLIGFAEDGGCDLLMDSDGAVYAARDEDLWKVGDAGVDALEALCTGRMWTPIRVRH